MFKPFRIAKLLGGCGRGQFHQRSIDGIEVFLACQLGGGSGQCGCPHTNHHPSRENPVPGFAGQMIPVTARLPVSGVLKIMVARVTVGGRQCQFGPAGFASRRRIGWFVRVAHGQFRPADQLLFGIFDIKTGAFSGKPCSFPQTDKGAHQGQTGHLKRFGMVTLLHFGRC